MASTTGRVSRVHWLADLACIFLELSPGREALFTLQFLARDSSFVTEYKRLLGKLINQALSTRRRVSILHDTDDSAVRGIDFVLANISPIGPPVHNDFYAISGNNIPGTADVVFESPSLTVTVAPDLRRPHWVLIEQLPPSIGAGPCTVHLEAPGWQSDRIPIAPQAGPIEPRRTLYSGRPSASPPYTFAFVATPGLEAESGGAVAVDPVRSNRSVYHDTVRHCLTNLLTVTESLLREDNLERNIRFVSIFDPASTSDTSTALVKRVPASALIEPKRERMNGYVGSYWEDPEIVFALSGSTTHTRAAAWYTTDKSSGAGVAYTYDGVARTHRRLTQTPGTAAISTFIDHTGLTAIHEFCHAASDFGNGMVTDLYEDDTGTGFFVNKKMRARPTDSIPASFASHGTTAFNSDTNRDGIGYPASWRSYHPELVDTTRPNLMDNYWLASSQIQACRLDRLTFQWFRDRLVAKVLR